jgi:hypothetical protein
VADTQKETSRHVTQPKDRSDTIEVKSALSSGYDDAIPIRLTSEVKSTDSQPSTYQVGSEDGLDLYRGGLLDADDGALGPRRGHGEPGGDGGGLLSRHGRLGRGGGGDGDGDGVLVRVHPRLKEAVGREAAARGVLGRRPGPGRRRRGRAAEAPPPLLLGAGRGPRRRGDPRQRQRQVGLRRRREHPGLVVPAPPAAREEASEPLARLAHLRTTGGGTESDGVTDRPAASSGAGATASEAACRGREYRDRKVLVGLTLTARRGPACGSCVRKQWMSAAEGSPERKGMEWNILQAAAGAMAMCAVQRCARQITPAITSRRPGPGPGPGTRTSGSRQGIQARRARTSMARSRFVLQAATAHPPRVMM